jgi:hypothetical protein
MGKEATTSTNTVAAVEGGVAGAVLSSLFGNNNR